MNKKNRYIALAAVIIFFGALFAWYHTTPGKYDSLATCLTEKGVTFYGAFWCPHCQATKQSFGKSVKLVNYVECSESTPNAQGEYGQLKVCQDKNIQSYPTWEFPDGSRLTGEIPLDVLAEKAACSI